MAACDEVKPIPDSERTQPELVAVKMRRIFCFKGAEFARNELQMGWEEIERLDAIRKEALRAAIMTLYLDDSSDFRNALWEIVEALDPEAHKLLCEDEGAARKKYAPTSDD